MGKHNHSPSWHFNKSRLLRHIQQLNHLGGLQTCVHATTATALWVGRENNPRKAAVSLGKPYRFRDFPSNQPIGPLRSFGRQYIFQSRVCKLFLLIPSDLCWRWILRHEAQEILFVSSLSQNAVVHWVHSCRWCRCIHRLPSWNEHFLSDVSRLAALKLLPHRVIHNLFPSSYSTNNI